MINLILAILMMCGTWMIADGLASLWAYLPHADESWWRNHSLRVMRMIVGLTIIVSAGYLMLVLEG